MEYNALHEHIGHKIELVDITDWHSNLEISIELRCTEKECENCEPLFELDNPDVIRTKNDTYEHRRNL